MNITLAENSGFCTGVKRADKSINALIKDNDGKIFTIGNLIHNRLYNEKLESLGVRSINITDIESILKENPSEKIKIVIRTHGIEKNQDLYLRMLCEKNSNLHVYDMTCPYVKKIHEIAKSNTNDDTVFLLFCDPNHPEAKGIISYAQGEKYTFSSLEELKKIQIGKKVPILCSQTTQNLLEFKKIKNFLEKLYTNLIFFDTICSVTEKRQNEAVAIAQSSDAMIVIGGRDSSNTHKLFDLCSEACEHTFWVESKDDLSKIDLPSVLNNIGITAGASTPDDIILEVIKQWKKN
ncbi:MAG: 4-hydroxy-3-methylbut-2-enyl diphosphate reductase [Clostridia bacterium]|nr:4-hydroxy-3-methylbut-2-enyl diphosphate reductase [Clostridia bacterium]